MKGTVQIAREVIAQAVAATAAARTSDSSTQHEVEAGVDVLEHGFQEIEPSVVLDIQLDAPLNNGLVIANDHASLFVPISNIGRAWRIDRSGLGKIETVVPMKSEDAVQRLVAALGSVVEDFDDWSRRVARRNGRVGG